ncbi:Mariner Mos1 transposase [Eumeta japonica]|uniref:Mariner Mos1 transposase n=1 Tax=Eumeta variegata TaxID=151549 RepID=A0A4C1TCP0_EUMVA|nr:Mariner Mos1 transposase [Eumeta japonica]
MTGGEVMERAGLKRGHDHFIEVSVGCERASPLRSSNKIPAHDLKKDHHLQRLGNLSRSAGNVTGSLYWDNKGVFMIEYLDRRTNVKSSLYVQQIKNLRNEIRKIRRGQQAKIVVFHQDNDSTHRSAVAMAAIRNAGLEISEHPLYLPDLASNDFYLLSRLKEY